MQPRRSLRPLAPRSLAPLALGALAVLLMLAAPARADVGVERVSRHAGEPGASVTLTLGCGFCFPPCVGPKGERHPKGFDHGPCMLGTKRDPPASFGVYLVPRSRGQQPTHLGLAVPPPGGNDPESGDPPRYLLHFAIPNLPPGLYTYEIWCGACVDGKRGTMIPAPSSRLWQLTVRPPSASTGGVSR
jgi:hypothetical protein